VELVESVELVEERTVCKRLQVAELIEIEMHFQQKASVSGPSRIGNSSATSKKAEKKAQVKA